MTYHVYENWTNKKAMIHHSECSRCRYGLGISGGKAGTKHGLWHGPFDTLDQAEAKAKSTNQPKMYCYFCKP